MIPTRGQVKTRALGLLDDAIGATYLKVENGVTPFDVAFQEAFDALFNAFLNEQIPAIQIISSYHLVANTTVLTPATAGLTDFANPELLEERAWGSVDKFQTVRQWDMLPQRNAGSALLDYVWRMDRFYFVGATTDRELRITYESSGTAPVSDGDSIGVDGSLTFLANYAVGVMGGRKGDDETANTSMLRAVGPKYNLGTIGGDLFRLVQPRVRVRQNVQVAMRPFMASSRRITRRPPYIAAQQPPSGGKGVPAQFTTVDGTITGTIDGVNASFFLAYPVTTIMLFVNDLLLITPLEYTFGANAITFAASQIPQPGDRIAAQGWI